MASPALLAQLGEALLADPIAQANKLTALLAAASSDNSEVRIRGSTAPNATSRLLNTPQACRKAAIQALALFFGDARQNRKLDRTVHEDEEGTVQALRAHREWLHRHLLLFKERLFAVLTDASPPALQVATLSAVLQLSKGSQEKPFQPDTFATALELILHSRHTTPELLAALTEHYVDFSDIRYYVFQSIHGIASKNASSSAGQNAGSLSKEAAKHLTASAQVPLEALCRNIHVLLAKAKPLTCDPIAGSKRKRSVDKDAEEPAEQPAKSWCGALESDSVRPVHTKEGSSKLKKRRRLDKQQGSDDKVGAKWATLAFQKSAFSNAWLSFLCLPLPEDLYRKVLVRLHEDVMPHLTNPHLLADMLTGALKTGGLVGMLALHAIFCLVTKHGLEYPAFYSRLYQLLHPTAFYAKHRVRFFELADVFLSSGLIPAYTAAAFIKKFSRLALSAPPAGAMVCLAFAHNLLRRHPACLILLDRQPAAPTDAELSAAAASRHGKDPFVESESDPAKTCALESSLWEVATLTNHFYPQVAAVAKQIIEKDLGDRRKTAEMDLGPLLGGSYTALLQAELSRRVRQVPTAFYARPPERLFDASSEVEFKGWALQA